jgi:hypothetical protein
MDPKIFYDLPRREERKVCYIQSHLHELERESGDFPVINNANSFA